MGCAPSAATASATSPRLSLTDDRKTTTPAEAATPASGDGMTELTGGGADARRRSYTGATNTRLNGDVPLTKASSFSWFCS